MIRNFRLFVKPHDENGKPLWNSYGWFNSNLESKITPFLSEAQIFGYDEETNKGSPTDWISLIQEDNKLWEITFRYDDQEPFTTLFNRKKRNEKRKQR